jgi:hypothetical protein
VADRSVDRSADPGAPSVELIDEDSVLTSIAQVRELSPEEARRQYPVRFEATLTFYDRAAPLVLRPNPAGAPEEFASRPAPHIFVQDETGGIFVWPDEWGVSVTLDSTLRVGDRVLVKGRTGPGAFVPIVEEADMERLGSGALPAPVSLPPSALLSGQYDSEWIQVQQDAGTAGWVVTGNVQIDGDLANVAVTE